VVAEIVDTLYLILPMQVVLIFDLSNLWFGSLSLSLNMSKMVAEIFNVTNGRVGGRVNILITIPLCSPILQDKDCQIFKFQNFQNWGECGNYV
jgi:hypothetical protein